ncbi:hypothetical protein [Luedemannella helvata]|uniref:hypothetical protein n=1 Tax=Luedemannella helvata TaxID=349315 RepID=UPI0031D60D2D
MSYPHPHGQQSGYVAPPVYVVLPAAPPPRRAPRRGMIIGLVAGIVFCGGGAGTAAYVITRAGAEAVEDINAELNAVRTDVKITGCVLKPSDFLATVEISWKATNSGTRKRTYAPRFDVETAGGTRVGQGIGFATSVDPGQTVRSSTTVLVDKTVKGKVTCTVSE